MKLPGIKYYALAVIFNIGIVCLLLTAGGTSGFSATRAGWIAAAIAAYLLLMIVVGRSDPNHPVLVYGIPAILMLIVVYEVNHGPSINLLTLILMTIGRIQDIRGLRKNEGKN